MIHIVDGLYMDCIMKHLGNLIGAPTGSWDFKTDSA